MKTALILSIALACILVLLMVIPYSPWGFMTWTIGKALLGVPVAIASETSPDGRFEAYVVESPSMDPPNQSLYVQRADKTRFLLIAQLAEDVDRIEEIRWSPDSRIVVFHSRYYLTATRVSDWTTLRIYLGREYVRSRPGELSTFSSPSPGQVEVIGFPERNAFSYRLSGQTSDRLGRFAVE